VRSSSLSVAVAQPAVVAHDVAANAARHAELVVAARGRVVVFPELSLTGYELDAAAVDPDDERLSALVAACTVTDAVVLAGAPVAHPAGGTSIGVLRVDGDGVTVAYRKLHLGSVEAAHMVPGGEPALVEVDGWRLGLAVCKDTGVPAHAAATAALGIDAYVAGVLEHAHDRDVVAERAVRIAHEHDVWVAVASFAGPTGWGYDRAAGCSGIWSPDGTRVAGAGPHVGEVVSATVTRR
jgi:predicted amidohydrolase